ncbi:MAG: hypothetical protein IPL61_35365 [Myxococcales bacterium]|nr:hypothetical protein [Myxococcales bacterium]
MEGIRDGCIGDDCFVCGLLWPHARPCPRCGGRGRWRDARMMTEGAVVVRVARALDAWHGASDVDALAALLDVVHQDAPASLDALAELGVDLDQLRRAWQRSAPDQVAGD